jgi:hypothetical protein
LYTCFVHLEKTSGFRGIRPQFSPQFRSLPRRGLLGLMD